MPIGIERVKAVRTLLLANVPASAENRLRDGLRQDPVCVLDRLSPALAIEEFLLENWQPSAAGPD